MQQRQQVVQGLWQARQGQVPASIPAVASPEPQGPGDGAMATAPVMATESANRQTEEGQSSGGRKRGGTAQEGEAQESPGKRARVEAPPEAPPHFALSAHPAQPAAVAPNLSLLLPPGFGASTLALAPAQTAAATSSAGCAQGICCAKGYAGPALSSQVPVPETGRAGDKGRDRERDRKRDRGRDREDRSSAQGVSSRDSQGRESDRGRERERGKERDKGWRGHVSSRGVEGAAGKSSNTKERSVQQFPSQPVRAGSPTRVRVVRAPQPPAQPAASTHPMAARANGTAAQGIRAPASVGVVSNPAVAVFCPPSTDTQRLPGLQQSLWPFPLSAGSLSGSPHHPTLPTVWTQAAGPHCSPHAVGHPQMSGAFPSPSQPPFPSSDQHPTAGLSDGAADMEIDDFGAHSV